MKITCIYPLTIAALAALTATPLRAGETLSGASIRPTAAPQAVGMLTTAAGFESYANAALIGQNGWASGGGSATAFNVTATSGVGGSKGVTATGDTTTYAYIDATYTPLAGELVSTNIDIAASDPALSATDAFGYLLDCYGSTNRIGRVGLAYSSNTIVAIVTTRFNATTGQFDPTVAPSNIVIASGLAANTFYNFETRYNFTLKTFDVYSGGNLIVSGCPFVTLTETVFSDADLQLSGATGATSSGAFDNYAVNVISAVPEPGSTAALLAGAAALGVAIRRRRS